jgi:hypothetical protein
MERHAMRGAVAQRDDPPIVDVPVRLTGCIDSARHSGQLENRCVPDFESLLGAA